MVLTPQDLHPWSAIYLAHHPGPPSGQPPGPSISFLALSHPPTVLRGLGTCGQLPLKCYVKASSLTLPWELAGAVTWPA